MFRDLGVLLQATWAEWAELRLERLLFADQALGQHLVSNSGQRAFARRPRWYAVQHVGRQRRLLADLASRGRSSAPATVSAK